MTRCFSPVWNRSTGPRGVDERPSQRLPRATEQDSGLFIHPRTIVVFGLLEQGLLDVGAIVARTGDDLVRYHGKFIVIDRTTSWLLGFNFTALDISRAAAASAS